MSGTLDVNGLQGNRLQDGSGSQSSGSVMAAEIRQFEAEIEKLLQELEAGQQGAGQPGAGSQVPDQQAQGSPQAPANASAGGASSPSGSSGAAASATAADAPQQPSPVAGANAPGVASPASATSGTPTTSAGSGPNAIQITNTTNEPMTIGKFKNGESTTNPSTEITLQPGQKGTLRYQNGEAGYAAKADASGNFQPNASRLEYEADADGRMKYPDVSYIDGRNASISLTDGSGLNKGDDKSIAAGAPAGAVQTDAAGDKTIAGYYDGSIAQMQAGADYMQSQLGTGGAYLHPNDDTLPAGQNPMSGTQSNTLYADFGNA